MLLIARRTALNITDGNIQDERNQGGTERRVVVNQPFMLPLLDALYPPPPSVSELCALLPECMTIDLSIEAGERVNGGVGKRTPPGSEGRKKETAYRKRGKSCKCVSVRV